MVVIEKLDIFSESKQTRIKQSSAIESSLTMILLRSC